MGLTCSGNCEKIKFEYTLPVLGHVFEEVKAHFSIQDKSYLGLRNILSEGVLSDIMY